MKPKLWLLNNDPTTLGFMANISFGMGALKFRGVLTPKEKSQLFLSGKRVELNSPVSLVRGLTRPDDVLLRVGLYMRGWVVARDVAEHSALEYLKPCLQIIETTSFTSSLEGFCILNFLNKSEADNSNSTIDFLKVEKEQVFVGAREKDALLSAGFPLGCFWEIPRKQLDRLA